MSASRWRPLGLCALSLLVALPARRAGAAGLSAPDPGAKALGMAGAVAARADDPTFGFFNPGGLALVPKGKLTAGAAGVYYNEAQYQGLAPGVGAGTSAQQEKRLVPLPHAYTLMALDKAKKLKVGVGLYSPYGFKNDWANPDAFAGRFVATSSELQTYDVNTVVAWKVSESFGLGVGAIYRTAKLSMGRRVSAFQVGVGPRDVGSLAIDSDWTGGVLWNAGLQWKMGERLVLGATYRAPLDLDLGGAGTLTQIETGSSQFDALNRATLPYDTALPVATSLSFPDEATVGLGFAVTKSFWLEVDVTRTGWSRFGGLAFNFTSEPNFSRTVQGAWEDTFTYKLGMQLGLDKGLVVRLGYALDQTPQPDASVSPFLADAERSVISAGIGRDWLDVAVQLIAPKSRATFTNASGVNGSYSGNTVVLAMSVTKK